MGTGMNEVGEQPNNNKIMFLQLCDRFMNELRILRTVSGGDTLIVIYEDAHIAALKTNGVLEIPEHIEAAQYILDKAARPPQDLDMVRTAIRYFIRYNLVECTRRDGTPVRLTSTDIKDICVDDIASINFILTDEYTRGWAKDTLYRREKKKAEKKKEAAAKIAKADVDRIVTAWNATDLPEVMRMTDKRRQKVAARVKSFGVDNVLKAIGKAGKSDLCHKIFEGKKEPWCDFDWLMKDDDNMAKTLEGKYDNADIAQAPAQEQVTPVNDDTIWNTILKEGIYKMATYTWNRARFEEVRPKLSPEMAAAIEAKMG